MGYNPVLWSVPLGTEQRSTGTTILMFTAKIDPHIYVTRVPLSICTLEYSLQWSI